MNLIARRRPVRHLAGVLLGAMALSATPLVGGGVAGAADPLPPLADPIADGAVCDGAPSTNPFSDLASESPATREVILCLVATELTSGTTSTTYSPGRDVTRRQMALFIKDLADLLNELELEPLTALPAYDNVPDYPDVITEDPEFRQAIGQLTQADIVGGFPDGTFRPAAKVSRRQMAAFVNRLEDHLRGEPYSTTNDYFDDDNGDSGEDDLNALASVGIFQGDGQGSVFPGGFISRRQMANILLRDAQVYFADGAILSPFDESFERLALAPTTVATLTPTAGVNATTPADDRDYEATALTSGQPYRITLFDPANIGTDDGDTTFVEDGSSGLADPGTITARIVEVNGSTLTGGQVAQSIGGVVPASGAIAFTVDGDQPEEVVPVIHTDQGGANTGLNLDSTSRPTEPFGVGGRIRYLGPEADAGTATVTVSSVTPERDAFTTTTNRTYFFDVNDLYRYQGGSITRDQFSAMLSAGDVVSATYDPDPDDVSTFNITSDAVAAPDQPTATVINGDSGATANDARITYVRPADNSPGVTYSLQRAVAPAGADGACGTSDDPAPTAPFVTVPGATQAPGDGVRTFVFSDNNVPDGCYAYRVVATSPTSGSSAASPHTSPNSRVPAVGDTTRPTSTFAKMTTVAGDAEDFDAGDVIQIVFSEPLGPLAANASITLNDGSDGGFTSATITRGTNATFEVNTSSQLVDETPRAAGTVLTITLSAPPPPSPSILPGLQVPATITASSGITDQSGNTWNVAASSDTEVES